jgi:hypothetical protein
MLRRGEIPPLFTLRTSGQQHRAMTRFLPKQPRIRLGADEYQRVRLKVLKRMAGDANPAAVWKTWKYTTGGFGVTQGLII